MELPFLQILLCVYFIFTGGTVVFKRTEEDIPEKEDIRISKPVPGGNEMRFYCIISRVCNRECI